MDAAVSILVTSKGPGLVPRPKPSSRGCPLWDPFPDTLPSPNLTRSAGLHVLLHFKVFIEFVTMSASVLSYGFLATRRGISALQPGIEREPLALEGGVLTTEPPGKSLLVPLITLCLISCLPIYCSQ